MALARLAGKVFLRQRMAGHRPEGAIGAVGQVVYRRFIAQPSKPGLPGVILEKVRATDVELVERLALSHDLLVTIEEGVLPGGFGSAVLEHLEDNFPDPGQRARVLRVGLPDRYVTHGKPELLREEVGFTGEGVAERVTAALGEEALTTP